MLSMIICTRDRCDRLATVLDSVSRMHVPTDVQWELIVVDNGSSDQTAEVVAGFADRLPIRRVFEGKAGLSNARNRGISEALGTYICWTDDDVQVDPQWLASYAAAFRAHPDATVFGGRIEPVLLGTTPAWFLAHRPLVARLLAERDLGTNEIPIDGSDHLIPYGANFAVRTVEQRRHLFDPNLGVGPGQRRLGEETAVIRAILADGATGWWVPNSRVKHYIPQERQSLAYLEEYERSSGETWAYLALRTPETAIAAGFKGMLIGGVPHWLWRRYLTLSLRRLLRRGGIDGAWLTTEINFGFVRGAIDYIKRRRQAR